MSRPRKPTDVTDGPAHPRSRTYVASKTMHDDPQAKIFAERLNKLMLVRGWRQRDVVTRAQPHLPKGITFARHLVSSWLTGKHMPSRINLDILCKVFGTTPEELVPEGVANVVGRVAAPMQMSSTPSGMSRLKIDMELPTEIAIQIMALAQKATH